MEELLARHRMEQRELQGRVTQKKKNASKKTRKGINDECEILERELKERQQGEIAALGSENIETGMQQLQIDEVENDKESTNNGVDGKQVRFAEGTEADIPSDQGQTKAKKPNRQKARLARRAAEQETQAMAAAEEAANLPDLRDQEMSSMKKEMEKRGLVETLIRPDGHCLFSACAHGIDADQVQASGPYARPHENVRSATADFMRQHPDDFAPFLEEPLATYARRINDTAEWGGQLELQAIARSYKVNINVLQADGRVEKFVPEQKAEKESTSVWLAYYRHSFGLGEHYNALHKADET